jgi:NAD-dependent dihydropyrimidine dehydrogenase PreA subunit
MPDLNIEISNETPGVVKKKHTARVEIAGELCKECLLCIEACVPDVLKVSESLNKMGYHPVEYIGEGCTGCGVCFYVCPEPGTIKVYKKIKAT